MERRSVALLMAESPQRPKSSKSRTPMCTSSIKSLANKKKYKAMKALESRETKGHHFIVADDLKNCPSFKSEAARRTVFSLLRHVKCVVEIRGPGSIVRYAAATNR